MGDASENLADQQADRLAVSRRVVVAWLALALISCGAKPASVEVPRVPERPKPCRGAPPPPEAPAQAGDCQPLRASPEADQFATELKQRVRMQDERLRVQVTFACSTVVDDLLSLSGIRSALHGDTLTLWKIQRTGAGFTLRALRLIAAGRPELAADSGEVRYLVQTLDATALQKASSRARLALAADVQTTLPAQTGIRLDAIVGSDGNAATELELATPHGHALRAFYGAGAEIPGASPHLALDLAWESLAPLFAAPFEQRPADDQDRALLAEVWMEATGRPSWIDDRLLELAASAGSPQLLRRILPALDASRPETQVRAVRALAAISRWDARRDAQGRVRDLAEVVSDYKRECSSE